MELVGNAKRVRIYLNEGDHVGHRPAHLAIIEFLRNEGAAGATVMRAIEGFHGRGRIHVSHLVDVEHRLPIVVEWIDRAEQVERLLGRIQAIVQHAVITVDDTEVVSG